MFTTGVCSPTAALAVEALESFLCILAGLVFAMFYVFARAADLAFGTSGDEDVHHVPPTGRGSRRDGGGVRKLGAL